MRLKVITKNGIELEQEVKSVTLPAVNGEMEVLPMHAGTVALLKTGELTYDNTKLPINEGVARIYNDEVTVLVKSPLSLRGMK